MFVQNLKEGDFIVCCDDKDKKYHDSYEYIDKCPYVLLVKKKKLPSITVNKVYRIFDKRIVDFKKKGRQGNLFDSKRFEFKIKSDKGNYVWVNSIRFRYDENLAINQSRFDTLSDILERSN